MNAHFAISMLLSLVIAAPPAGRADCDARPSLEIFDARATIVGDTLRGDRVIDGSASKDSEPLEFSRVRLYSGKKVVQQTRTDAQGRFVLDGLSIGSYTLSFEGMGKPRIEVVPPRILQQFFYIFRNDHGCLDYGMDAN
jgi:hypothetical protein